MSEKEHDPFHRLIAVAVANIMTDRTMKLVADMQQLDMPREIAHKVIDLCWDELLKNKGGPTKEPQDTRPPKTIIDEALAKLMESRR